MQGKWPKLDYIDARSFLEVLADNDLLHHIKRQVDRRFEVAAGIRKISDENGPALIFDDVSGFDVPIMGGLFATRQHSLLAMGVDDYEEAVLRFGYGVQNPIKPKIVGEAECQQVVYTGEDINLLDLPHPIYSEGDSGPFISSGTIFTHDPESRIGNVGIYRMEVKGPRTLCLEAPPYQHVSVARGKAERAGKSLEIAIAIGADPVIYYASQAKVGYEIDELEIAGGIRGEPIEVIKGLTVDINVPAKSEIVIEGYFIPGERMQEGPFGEFTGYQTATRLEPVIEVTAITTCRNPIYQAVLTGRPTTENHILKTFGYDWSLFQFLKNQFPEVTAATLPVSGGVQYLAVVAIDQDHIGQARKVLLATLASPVRAKFVIVVDSDVDIYNIEEVLWAVTMHSQPASDVIVIPNVAGSRIDPSSTITGLGDLLGIDATRPLDQSFPPLVTIPGVSDFRLK